MILERMEFLVGVQTEKKTEKVPQKTKKYRKKTTRNRKKTEKKPKATANFKLRTDFLRFFLFFFRFFGLQPPPPPQIVTKFCLRPTCMTDLGKNNRKEVKQFLNPAPSPQEDGPEYEEKKFWARMGDFKFWLMTNSEPEPEILEKFYVIRVKPSPPKH